MIFHIENRPATLSSLYYRNAWRKNSPDYNIVCFCFVVSGGCPWNNIRGTLSPSIILHSLPYTPLQAAHIACPYMSSSNCSICICTLCAIPTSTSSQFTIPQYETHAMVRISSCCPPPPGTETTTPPSSTTQEEQQQKKEPSAKQRKIAHQWRLSVFSKGYDNDDAKHATRSSCATKAIPPPPTHRWESTAIHPQQKDEL